METVSGEVVFSSSFGLVTVENDDVVMAAEQPSVWRKGASSDA